MRQQPARYNASIGGLLPNDIQSVKMLHQLDGHLPEPLN